MRTLQDLRSKWARSVPAYATKSLTLLVVSSRQQSAQINHLAKSLRWLSDLDEHAITGVGGYSRYVPEPGTEDLSERKSWFSDCGRDEHGRCLPKGQGNRSGKPDAGAGSGKTDRSDQASQERSGERSERGQGRTATARRTRSKQQGKLARFRSAAVKWKVQRGLANEKKLADATSGHNLPDSEPADCVLVVSPDGELLSAGKDFNAREFFRLRQMGLAMKKHPPEPLPSEAELEDLLQVQPHETRVRARQHYREDQEERRKAQEAAEAEVALIEVKTLLTSKRGAIKMSQAAVKRKERLAAKQQAKFWTIIFDDRKGKKYSNNRLYCRMGVGNMKLEDTTAVGSFDDILNLVGNNNDEQQERSQ